MSKPGCYLFHPVPLVEKKNQSVMFSKISNVETVSEYTLRYTESCKWISVNMNMFFWFKKTKRFSVSKFPARPWFNYPFYQHSLSIKTQIVDRWNELKYFHSKYYHTLSPVCTFNKYHKRFFLFFTKTIHH